jgi:hypothetical protein
MNTLIRHATIVSTFALMTAATAGLASAQDSYGGQDNYCAQNPDQCGNRQMQQMQDQGDQGYIKKRRIEADEGQTTNDQGYMKKRRLQVDEGQAMSDQSDQPRMRHASSDWQFDPNKHRRHRHRDSEFRFYFGGFYYPEPYWLGYGYGLGVSPYRIGCGEGRAIVREHGFYRVRTVECYGRAYTYLGRRHGDTFQVLVSARSGRIIDVNPI